MHKMLIVDDEQKLREGLRDYAEFMGYAVTEAADGMEAVMKVRENHFDIIIMDVMMPKLDGFSACQERKKINAIPVLMLSARSEEYDKLYGFELGIDDYVAKPFSPKEVLARVQAIINRHSKAARVSDADVYSFDGLMINIAARSVTIDGERIELSPKEYDLLYYLALNKNIALSRGKLLSEVWGYAFYGSDRTIDTHIKTLRMNLKNHKWRIVTLRGVGYRFEA
jgi:DNA-binding response OmpR family regulator